MTASERAQNLIDELIAAAHDDGVLVANGFLSRVKALDRRRASEAALLAYVADLEACVAAARDVVDSANADVVFGSDLSTEERRLAELMAALDRPEDGTNGDARGSQRGDYRVRDCRQGINGGALPD